MTHAELVKLAERWLWRQGCGVVLREFSTTATAEIPDAIGWRSHTSILVECKVSRADFLADASKPFRKNPYAGVGRWRFYLTPPGLLRAEELPVGWGLLEVRGGRVFRVHGGPRGNLWSVDPPLVPNAEAEHGLLYSALRRLALRGRLPEVYLPRGEHFTDADTTDLQLELSRERSKSTRLHLELTSVRQDYQRLKSMTEFLTTTNRLELEGRP